MWILLSSTTRWEKISLEESILQIFSFQIMTLPVINLWSIMETRNTDWIFYAGSITGISYFLWLLLAIENVISYNEELITCNLLRKFLAVLNFQWCLCSPPFSDIFFFLSKMMDLISFFALCLQKNCCPLQKLNLTIIPVLHNIA